MAKAKKFSLKTPTVVSFLNYKGGVGKTNVSVNFAYYAAAELGLRTLLIDWDPQGDATEYIGLGRDNVPHTMFDFLVERPELELGSSIPQSAYDNLWVIGANATLKNVENLVVKSEDTFETFREIVHECASLVDLVVIDCPPANSHVNIASIFASTHVFVVTTPASDSIDKIQLVNQMIVDIASVIEDNAPEGTIGENDIPTLKGILMTMGVENTVGVDVAREHMKSTWESLLLEPMIPRAVAAQYSVSECVPVLKSKPNDKLSRRYRELFSEVINRVV